MKIKLYKKFIFYLKYYINIYVNIYNKYLFNNNNNLIIYINIK